MAFKHWSSGRKLLLISSGVSLAIAAYSLGGIALRVRTAQRLADSPHSEVNQNPGVLPPAGVDRHFAAFQSDPKNASPQTLVNKTNSDEALLNAALTATKSPPAKEESPLPDDFIAQEPYEKGWSARKAIVLGRSSTGEVTFLLNGAAATQYYEHLYEANVICRDCDILVWKQLGTKYKLVLQAQGNPSGLAFESTSTNGEKDIVLRAGQTENMSMLSLYKYDGERYQVFTCFQEGQIPNRYDMLPPYHGSCVPEGYRQ